MTQTVRRYAPCATLCALICLAATACGAPQQQVVAAKHEPADARVKALADAYLSGFFDRNPDQATYFGVPGRHHDQLPDNSLAAQKAWEAKEDAWLKDARASLDRAEHNKGGWRDRAIGATDTAIQEVTNGCSYADTH